MSEASCPNFEPRAHARLTGLTSRARAVRAKCRLAGLTSRAQQFQCQLISMLPNCERCERADKRSDNIVKRSENLASLLRARVSHAIRASAIAKIHKNEIVLVDDRRP